MNTETLRLWWTERSTKEKWALQLAALAVVGAVLWSIALAPAVRTLKSYEANRLKLDADLLYMQSLQAQAQALQALPRLSQATATQALRESVQKAFGKNADITVYGASATVTLRDVAPDTLAQWLTSARTEAHSAPVQAHLTNTSASWSGTLQMALPTP